MRARLGRLTPSLVNRSRSATMALCSLGIGGKAMAFAPDAADRALRRIVLDYRDRKIALPI